MGERAAKASRRPKAPAQAPATTAANADPGLLPFFMLKRNELESAEAWIERSLLDHGFAVRITRIAAAMHEVNKRMTIGVVRRLIDGRPDLLTARSDGTVIPAMVTREAAAVA